MLFRLLKRLFILALVVFLCLVVWTGFAIWSGTYSIYTYPPSRANPEGVTLLISRETREPMFNSPQYIPPKRKPEPKKEGVGFGQVDIKSVKPVESRIVSYFWIDLAFPYLEWAYEESLNEKQLEAFRKGRLKQMVR